MAGGKIFVMLVLMTSVCMGSACGRKVALDTQHDAAVQARKDAQKAAHRVGNAPQKSFENRPFILDTLL